MAFTCKIVNSKLSFYLFTIFHLNWKDLQSTKCGAAVKESGNDCTIIILMSWALTSQRQINSGQ